jgi:hypothetical protein
MGSHSPTEHSTGSRFAASPRYVCPSRTPSAQLPQIGKLQEAFGPEPLQQLPALVILQPSAGPLEGTRDLSHAEGGELQRGLAHQFQLAGAERASAKGEGFRHALEKGAGQPAPVQCPGSRSVAHAIASRSA